MNQKVDNMEDCTKVIQEARSQGMKHVNCNFALCNKVAIHPQKGIPLLYNDQLNIAAKHM